MQNKRPSHHFVSCEIQIDNCYFMSYNIYNNVGNKKDQERSLSWTSKKSHPTQNGHPSQKFQSYVLLYCEEQQHVIRVAQSHCYRLWGVSRHGPLDAAYASRTGSPL